MTKRLRGVSKCLPEIQAEMDVANSIPPQFPYKGTHSYNLVNNINFFYDLTKTAATPAEKRSREQKIFKKIILELPKDFVAENKWITDILEGKTITLDDSLKTSENEFLKTLFEHFRDEYNEGEWIEFTVDSNNPPQMVNPLAKLQGEIMWTKDRRSVLLKVVEWNKELKNSHKTEIFPKRQLLCFTFEEGVLDFKILSPFLQTLKDLKVDTRRIGQCETCHKFFWRQRENAATCSRNCANKYHQKTFQSDEQKRASLNEKRRKNYQRKKKLEETKKKNGNL